MAEVLSPDICVIGGGVGGRAVAAAAAALGTSVVLVDKGPIGEPFLRESAVAAQALKAAASRAYMAETAKPLGIGLSRVAVDFGAVHDHIQHVMTAIAPKTSHERMTALGVRIVEAEASFRDHGTVTAGEIEIRARRFVIATGSSPVIPPIEGLAETPHFTTDTVFDLRVCPKQLVVLGAGATGLELAQAYRRLGAEVTLLDPGEPLAGEDSECAAVVLDQAAREGVAIRANAAVLRVKRNRARIQVAVRDNDAEATLEASHLLIAAGRQPNIEGLALERAGVVHERGRILVNDGLRTSNTEIYAIGDVIGGPSSVHRAEHHAALVVGSLLLRQSAKTRDLDLPRVVFTDPELAQIGLTEAVAREKRIPVRIARWPYRDNDRALAERQTLGHIKIITDRKGRILGVTIVGAQASESIGFWMLAIRQKLKLQALAGMPLPYPALAGVGKAAAISYGVARLTRPLTRSIMGLLRRFG